MGVIDKVQVGGTTYDVQDVRTDTVMDVLSLVDYGLGIERELSALSGNLSTASVSFDNGVFLLTGSLAKSTTTVKVYVDYGRQIVTSGSSVMPSGSVQGVTLVNGHTYRVRMEHISGSYSGDNTYVSPVFMKPGAIGAQGTDGVLVYDASTYDHGIFAGVSIGRNNNSEGITFSEYGYKFRLIVEDITDGMQGDGNLAPVDTPTATSSHASGSLLMMGGQLYKATSAIAATETIDPGTGGNVESTTVADQLAARDTAIAAEASDRTTEDNSLDQRVNVLHGLVDYGYSTPYYSSGGAATRIRTLFTVNNSWNSSSNPVAFRLNGTIKSATTNTGIDEYTNPLKLTVGHTYSWQMTPISGTVTTGSWVPAVYTSGGHETAAGAYTYPDGTKHLDFTYTQAMDTAGGVQLCFRAMRTSGVTFTNFCVQCVLVDTTPGQRNLPFAPTTDGTYTLKVTVSSGVPTYSWVADT